MNGTIGSTAMAEQSPPDEGLSGANTNGSKVESNSTAACKASAGDRQQAAQRSRRKPNPGRFTYTEQLADDLPFIAGQKLVLEEPFSETDEDEQQIRQVAKLSLGRKARQHHLSLPLPMQRTRTLSGTIPPVGYSPVWGGPTMCLKCLEFFDLPNETADYVEHLVDKHRIVIADIDLIVDLKRYVEYWRHRFGDADIDAHFAKATPDERSPLYGRVDSYYLMGCQVAEDREIREKLATSRLEEVIACQQRERADRTFCRQCLFCRYVVRGNRAKYVHHLYIMHRLNLGSPDNLVFISEYIDILAEKLQKNVCLYCEQQFADHSTMMSHVHAAGHRKVNPKNSVYDKFYLINYLELGKKWHEVMAEDFEDVLDTFADSDEASDSDAAWTGWVEEENGEGGGGVNLVCMLCDRSLCQLHDLLAHQIEEHNFDLQKAFDEMALEFYERVKFVNYVRQMVYKMECFVCGKSDTVGRTSFVKHVSQCCFSDAFDFPSRECWDKEEYLIPLYENDYLLTQLDEISGRENAVDRMLFTKCASTTATAMYSVAEPDAVSSESPPSIEDSVLSDKKLMSELS